jgi:hypothetical protein
VSIYTYFFGLIKSPNFLSEETKLNAYNYVTLQPMQCTTNIQYILIFQMVLMLFLQNISFALSGFTSVLENILICRGSARFFAYLLFLFVTQSVKR